MDSKWLAQVLEDRYWNHCQGSIKQNKLQNSYPHTDDLVWSHIGSLAVCLESVSFNKLNSAVSVDFPIMFLSLLARMIPPPSFTLNSWSWAQCLAFGRLICFFQLLDEGSMDKCF